MNPVHSGPELSVVIPVYNETDVITDFSVRLEKTLDTAADTWEAIFVDDGSRDDTWQKLLAYRGTRDNITLISLSRRFGKDTAIFAALERVRGEAAIVIDADLQDPPEIIPKMIEKWRAGADIVIGVRDQRRGERLPRAVITGLFYKLLQAISDSDMPPDSGDLCLLNRRAIEAVNRFPEKTRYFKGLINWIGFRREFIHYTREERQGGRSKWNFLRLAAFAIDAITAYSRLPLRIWTVAGMAAALLGFCYGVYVFLYTIFLGGEVPGYASLVMLILFLGGVQLISIGVLSEYIGHLFIETKNRPLFIIREIKEPDEFPDPPQ
ncbi:MAG: glycosyltransferase family 2 protein [Desulfosudaceae bacterium]